MNTMALNDISTIRNDTFEIHEGLVCRKNLLRYASDSKLRHLVKKMLKTGDFKREDVVFGIHKEHLKF